MEYKLIINFKTYKESFNKNAIKLAKICKELEKEAKKLNVEIIVSPQTIDLKDTLKEKTSIYSQTIDDFDFGAHTGYIIPKALKELKIKGSIINHSEHKFPLKEVEKRINSAKKVGLITCVCAEKVNDVKNIAKFSPDMIAVEPKELIGGDISISTAKPELITKSIKNSNGIDILVGAGVKNGNDVKKAIELGAKGILVASGVVKAKNPKKAILDLLKGFEI